MDLGESGGYGAVADSFLAVHPGGIVGRVGLTRSGATSVRFDQTGTYTLEMNTTSSEQSGIKPGVTVSVTGAELTLLGFDFALPDVRMGYDGDGGYYHFTAGKSSSYDLWILGTYTMGYLVTTAPSGWGRADGLPKIQPLGSAPRVDPSHGFGADQWGYGGAESLSAELLVNGGNDATAPGDPPAGWMGDGWSASEHLQVNPHDGQTYFFAGEQDFGALYQDVPVADYAATIDAGSQEFIFIGYVQSLSETFAEICRIQIMYLDDFGNELGKSFDTGNIVNASGQWQLVTDRRAGGHANHPRRLGQPGHVPRVQQRTERRLLRCPVGAGRRGRRRRRRDARGGHGHDSGAGQRLRPRSRRLDP